MKFKIGQRVRIVGWVDMPEDVRGVFILTPAIFIGKEVIIYKSTVELGKRAYEVDFVDKGIKESGYLLFEKELEPVIRVGEQLMFEFMR